MSATLREKLEMVAAGDSDIGEAEREACREAAALIAKLPTTADGVPVAPNDQVYNLSPEGNAMAFRVLGGEGYFRCKSPVEANTRAVAKCYSTAAAALAVAFSEKGKE